MSKKNTINDLAIKHGSIWSLPIGTRYYFDSPGMEAFVAAIRADVTPREVPNSTAEAALWGGIAMGGLNKWRNESPDKFSEVYQRMLAWMPQVELEKYIAQLAPDSVLAAAHALSDELTKWAGRYDEADSPLPDDVMVAHTRLSIALHKAIKAAKPPQEQNEEKNDNG